MPDAWLLPSAWQMMVRAGNFLLGRRALSLLGRIPPAKFAAEHRQRIGDAIK